MCRRRVALLFTKITVDAHGVTGKQLAEPFDTLVPLGRHFTQHGTRPTLAGQQDAPETDTDLQHGSPDDYGQPEQPPGWP
jgi:hypothetical protein